MAVGLKVSGQMVPRMTEIHSNESVNAPTRVSIHHSLSISIVY